MNKQERCGHVRAIQRAVEAQLPEDEPDDVRLWVYETAVKVMAERLAPPARRCEGCEKRLDRRRGYWTADDVLLCKQCYAALVAWRSETGA